MEPVLIYKRYPELSQLAKIRLLFSPCVDILRHPVCAADRQGLSLLSGRGTRRVTERGGGRYKVKSMKKLYKVPVVSSAVSLSLWAPHLRWAAGRVTGLGL